MKTQLSEIKALFEEAISKYNAGECLIKNEPPFGKLSVIFNDEMIECENQLSKVTISCKEADVSENFYITKSSLLSMDFQHNIPPLELEFMNTSFASVFIARKTLVYTNSIYLYKTNLFEFLGMFGLFCEFKKRNPKHYRNIHKQVTHETLEEKMFMQEAIKQLFYAETLDYEVTDEFQYYYHFQLMVNNISAKCFKKVESAFEETIKEHGEHELDDIEFEGEILRRI